MKQSAFLTCSWRFLRSITLEQLEFKLLFLQGVLGFGFRPDLVKVFFSTLVCLTIIFVHLLNQIEQMDFKQ